MHPNPAYREPADMLQAALFAPAAFGTVFAQTPDGPAAAMTPFLREGDTILFHLAKANRLTPHLEGSTVLIQIAGPHGYVSPRWYDRRDTVPTWDYAAAEYVGTAQAMDDGALEHFLHRLIGELEAHTGPNGWSAGEASEATWRKLIAGVRGFAVPVTERRPTAKLSQGKPAAVRARIAEGHRVAGNPQLAEWMDRLAPGPAAR